MTALLLVIVALLLGIAASQRAARIRRDRGLRYMREKLGELNAQGETGQLLLFTQDRLVQDLLVELNVLLDRSRKLKTEQAMRESSVGKMLANMSHDLKTPLTVVLGLAETLADGATEEEERKRLIPGIHRKAGEMLELINKFFDLARLEAGEANLPLSKVNMCEVCKNAILFYYETIESLGYEAVVDIPDEPVFSWSNEEAMSRILKNLISNAIRYGCDGRMVGIRLNADGKRLAIEVWDRGKGILAPYQELVFERLYTLEDSRNRSFQGSGLGLTITKRLVSQLGGSISLSSAAGEKTVFTLHFDRLS